MIVGQRWSCWKKSFFAALNWLSVWNLRTFENLVKEINSNVLRTNKVQRHCQAKWILFYKIFYIKYPIAERYSRNGDLYYSKIFYYTTTFKVLMFHYFATSFGNLLENILKFCLSKLVSFLEKTFSKDLGNLKYHKNVVV